MFDSVQKAFRALNEPVEGVLNFMYLDKKGLVTIAMGNLIDSIPVSQQLPFFFKEDQLQIASADEIADDWKRVKARQDLKDQGGGAFESVALLRINEQTIDELVDSKLSQTEVNLKTVPEYIDFETWPADAELGLLSMAWAMGPKFNFPAFRKGCSGLDFVMAADECHISETGNPGIIPRNLADEILFLNAARVLANDLAVEDLIYPNILTSDGTILEMGLSNTNFRYPALTLGDKGQPVAIVQTLLGLDTTGSYDGDTQTAVKAFQSSHSLTSDGVVGPNTWRALVRDA